MGTIEPPEHMFKLMGKETNAILGAQTILIWTYADIHWLHARIQDFFSQVGVQARRSENSLDNGFCFQSSTYFTVYRGGPMVWLQSKHYFYTFPRIQRGSKIFKGGGSPTLFPGGCPNANFYRNPYNLWYLRGVRTPYPPSGSVLGLFVSVLTVK